MALPEKPAAVRIKTIRGLDAVEIFFSLDGENYQMSNLSYFPVRQPAIVGIMAASPGGDGFKAVFEDFKIKHLPDQRRTEWLEKN